MVSGNVQFWVFILPIWVTINTYSIKLLPGTKNKISLIMIITLWNYMFPDQFLKFTSNIIFDSALMKTNLKSWKHI
jgi:hypothetical protein